MTQYVIDIGAAANDGTGDPLRTAFNEVNLNFDQVFAAGPVLSNVRIANNTILTLNTNGNLILAPNGTGVVQSNVSIVPNTSNLRNLGSATRRWSDLYVQYANISGNIDLAGTFSVGDLSVSGNLTVIGNTIQIGNLVTDAKTIQLANTAASANAASGSGITVGADDDIATFLYDSGNNVWTTNIGVSVGGPITGTSIAVSDATIYGNLNGLDAYFTGTVYSPNIVVNNITSDDSTFVIINDGLDVQGDITAETLSTTGNVTANYFFGDGSQLTGLPAGYANANVESYAETGWSGNIIPAGNGIYSLGNSTNYWSNLFVSGNTIFIGGVPLGVTGNVLTVNGEPILSNDSNSSVVTTGNITAENFFGNTQGSTGNITNLVSLNFDVENISARGNAGVNIGAGGFNNLVVLETGVLVQNVPLSVTGNVTANSFIGNGSQLTNLPITYTNLIENGNSNVVIATADGNVTVTANTATWNFGTSGNLTFPGGGFLGQVWGDGVDNELTLKSPTAGGNAAYVALSSANEQNYVEVSNSGVVLAVNFNTEGLEKWTFDTTGNLTVPGNINFGGDASAAPSLNDFAGVTSAANFAVTIDSANSASTWSFETGDVALGEFDDSPILRTPVGAGSVIYNETLMAILAGNIDAGERSSVRLLEGGVSLLGTTSLDGELSTIIMEVNTGGVGIRALGDAAPRLSVVGNVTGGNILTAGSVTANGNVIGGNISTAGTVSATGNLSANNVSTGNVVATRVQNDGNLEIRSNVAGTARIWTFDAIGDFNTPPAGNISVGGRLSANRITAEGNISATGNVSGGNLISSATIYGNVDVVLGNIANASATKTRMVTDTTFSYIQTGNGTIDTTGNIVFSPYLSTTQRVVIDTASGNLSATGNITASNFLGNGAELSNVATKFLATWSVPTGNSTQSFTVDPNNTYQMWVEGNIPNGIIVWNATVTVTNTNVPVLGQQFAWNYEGGGNILLFNSLPDQFVGTAGAISNAEPAVANTNVFSFGINNSSGNTVSVNYGWTQIS